MGLSWGKLEPSWGQVGSSRGQVRSKLSQVGQVGRSCPKMAPNRAKLAPNESKLRPSWPQVGSSWGPVGPSWSQVRAKLSQVVAKMEPSWLQNAKQEGIKSNLMQKYPKCQKCNTYHTFEGSELPSWSYVGAMLGYVGPFWFPSCHLKRQLGHLKEHLAT